MSEEDPIVLKCQQGLESICYFNRQISKERYHLLPSLSPWKTNVPKFMPIPRCEYSVPPFATVERAILRLNIFGMFYRWP